ncbi:MAG: hypothetical protein K2X99_00660 [Gemmatimonadaceae bacterium]|nr:hypothetical protein [Gemmatimonadaceae bacterium]
MQLNAPTATAVTQFLELLEDGRKLDLELSTCPSGARLLRAADRHVGWMANRSLKVLGSGRTPVDATIELRSIRGSRSIRIRMPTVEDLLRADQAAALALSVGADETCYSKCCDLAREFYQVNYFINNPTEFFLSELADTVQDVLRDGIAIVGGEVAIGWAGFGADIFEMLYNYVSLSRERQYLAGQMRENNCLQ